jgi:hypothetical protein
MNNATTTAQVALAKITAANCKNKIDAKFILFHASEVLTAAKATSLMALVDSLEAAGHQYTINAYDADSQNISDSVEYHIAAKTSQVTVNITVGHSDYFMVTAQADSVRIDQDGSLNASKYIFTYHL